MAHLFDLSFFKYFLQDALTFTIFGCFCCAMFFWRVNLFYLPKMVSVTNRPKPWLVCCLEEDILPSYISKKVATHPDIAHPFGNPPTQLMKGFPAYSLLVKVARGVFQRCVETTLEYRDDELSHFRRDFFGSWNLRLAQYFSISLTGQN